MAARDEDRQSDLAVMEANEYKQKRRLERILDALDEVEYVANEAWGEFVAGHIDHTGKNIAVQRAVKAAIRESYNLLHEYARDEETGGEYWTRAEAEQPLGIVPQKTREDIVIQGLRDFMLTDPVYREERTETVKQPNMPAETETEVLEQSVPEEVSWRAYLMLKRFLAQEHDLEVTFEELDDSLPTWGFEEVQEDDTAETQAKANGDS